MDYTKFFLLKEIGLVLDLLLIVNKMHASAFVLSQFKSVPFYELQQPLVC